MTGTSTDLETAHLERLRLLVAEHFQSLRRPNLGRVDNLLDIDLSPNGRWIAATASIFDRTDTDAAKRVCVIEIDSGELVMVTPPDLEGYAPRWSPDGTRLGWIESGPGRPHVALARWTEGLGEGDLAKCASSVERVNLPGVVEYLDWSPDSCELVVGVAEDGADQSDVVGSGRLPTLETPPGWQPIVAQGTQSFGWRSIWRYGLSTRDLSIIDTLGRNVWQACWAGAGRLACITSADPSESSWYESELCLVDLSSFTVKRLFKPDRQIASPACSPDGNRVSVIVGSMSDRGMYVGDVLVVDAETGSAVALDVGDVDVTWMSWIDSSSLLVAGLSGTRTAIKKVDVETSVAESVWASQQTCGGLLPSAAASAQRLVAVANGYGEPPTLALLVEGKTQTSLSLSHPGHEYLAKIGGALEHVEWRASDGRLMDGVLATPTGQRPKALVVHVHGGPVWAWRDQWSMNYPYTPILVSQGYAVLHPNVRGSAGHGQDFVRAGLYDMGAADATDVEEGVRHLVEEWGIDPSRVAVMGNSYGGFMAAWLAATSSMFSAAICRSPVTDWVSQHYTSNIPGFDSQAFSGSPLDPASLYRTRSPLYLVSEVRIPVLLIAGALDLATPPEQAEMFHRALIEQGCLSTLLVYPQEGHGIRHHDAQIDHIARMLQFLARHIPADEE